MKNRGNHLGDKFRRALQQTYQLFGADKRKGGEIPYIAHLLSVCSLVLYDGGDEDEAVAALLHDVLEDKPEQVTREQIQAEYGERVLAIVDASTDTPEDYQGGVKPPWMQRKLEYLDRAARTDPKLLRVTVADKVDNAMSLLEDHAQMGVELWKRFNASKEDIQWYYKSSVDVYRKAGVDSRLLVRLVFLVSQLEKL